MLTLLAGLVGIAWTAVLIAFGRKKPKIEGLRLEGNYTSQLLKTKLDKAQFNYEVLEDLGVDDHTLEVARQDVVTAMQHVAADVQSTVPAKATTQSGNNAPVLRRAAFWGD